ncbi:MAG: YjbE family putative metal transport protein [Rubrivivax sp.]|nr:YjbE family putative metal transport protein [Rubrivivax sp.]
MDMFTSVEFWIAVGQIIMIDILLGGDNAVVIALACRKLPAEQRRLGILWGTAGAIALRVVLIFFALQLLAIPFLKIVGALLLVWIGVKLLMPEHEGEGHAHIEGSDRLWGAVKTVIIADFVMSVDNVIAIAGAAESSGTGHGMALVIFGVLVSIPIIVWGSQLVLKLMDRYPVIITAGGMLLGWIAGTMAVSDLVFTDPNRFVEFPKLVQSDALRLGAGAAGALLVLAIGRLWGARSAVAAAPATASAQPGALPAAAGTARRVLLAVDGSEPSLRAVHRLIDLRHSLRDATGMQIHLLNVQRPVSRDVATFVASQSLDEYHLERSEAALATSRTALDGAGVPYTAHRKVGSPGPTIAETAASLGCDLIVLGARGLGSNTAALLGSVAHGAIEAAGVPVLVVK